MTDWIPVTERLPQIGKDVLFTGYFLGVQKGFLKTRKETLENSQWENSTGTILEVVTHWMPLPELPVLSTELFSLSNDWKLQCGDEQLDCTFTNLPQVVHWLNSLPLTRTKDVTCCRCCENEERQ